MHGAHQCDTGARGVSHIGAVHMAATGVKILDRPKISLDLLTTPDLCVLDPLTQTYCACASSSSKLYFDRSEYSTDGDTAA